MTEVAVLGAAGGISRQVTDLLRHRDDVELTLFVRDSRTLVDVPAGARVVEGDVLDREALDEALRGQDVVVASLSGAMDEHAQTIVDSMQAVGARRFIEVLALGIYDEVPGAFGAWNTAQIGPYLPPFRRAADIIEGTDLDYTILRPAWLSDEDETVYETTARHQPFGGTEVARRAVAALISEIVKDPRQHSRANLGVHKPGTDGDKPSFM